MSRVSRHRSTSSALFAIAALMVTGPTAVAQLASTPDQGRIIVEQTERDALDRPVLTPPRAEDFLTGDGDLLLLEKFDLFYLRTDSELIATSNATLSDDANADLYLVQEFVGGWRTVLDEKVAVYAETGFNVRLYVDNDELNSTVAFFRTGASTRVGPNDDFIIGGDVAIDLIRDDFFNDDINDQVTLDAYVAKPIILEGGAVTFTPRGTGLVVFGDVSDFNKIEGIVGSDFAYRFFGEDVPEAIRDRLLIVASVDGFGRYYFDFFEEFTGETRFDFGVRGGTGLRYFFNDRIAARTEVSLTYQTSTVDALDYFEAAASAGVWLEYRF